MLRLATSSLRPAVRTLASEAPRAVTGKLRLNLAAPHEVFVNNEVVDQVNLPSTSGDMGLLADHVPMISQLRPGVVDVIVGGKSSKRIFVSGGFAIMNPDSSLNITAVEAVPVDYIDTEAARRTLADATKEVDRASNDVDRARAQIVVEVATALVAAGSA